MIVLLYFVLKMVAILQETYTNHFIMDAIGTNKIIYNISWEDPREERERRGAVLAHSAMYLLFVLSLLPAFVNSRCSRLLRPQLPRPARPPLSEEIQSAVLAHNPEPV